jgi:hypothetical protein
MLTTIELMVRCPWRRTAVTILSVWQLHACVAAYSVHAVYEFNAKPFIIFFMKPKSDKNKTRLPTRTAQITMLVLVALFLWLTGTGVIYLFRFFSARL